MCLSFLSHITSTLFYKGRVKQLSVIYSCQKKKKTLFFMSLNGAWVCVNCFSFHKIEIVKGHRAQAMKPKEWWHIYACSMACNIGQKTKAFLVAKSPSLAHERPECSRTSVGSNQSLYKQMKIDQFSVIFSLFLLLEKKKKGISIKLCNFFFKTHLVKLS